MRLREEITIQGYPRSVPVLIAGAGPTGLTTGLLLLRHGVKSLIVDRNATALNIPCAIVLDDEGSRTLHIFGADARYLTDPLIGDGAAYVDDGGDVFARVGAGPASKGGR